MTSLVMRTPNGPLARISSASASAASSSVVVGHDRRDEPDALGLARVDEAAGEHQLVRARRADQPRQDPARPDVARRQPDLDERDVEAGGLGAAMRMSLPSASASPPPDAAPLTAAMIGCGCAAHQRDQAAMYCCTRMPACGRPDARRGPGSFDALGEVEPGAEALARAGEHDHPARAVVAQRRRARRTGPPSRSQFIALRRSGRFSVIDAPPASSGSVDEHRAVAELLRRHGSILAVSALAPPDARPARSMPGAPRRSHHAVEVGARVRSSASRRRSPTSASSAASRAP